MCLHSILLYSIDIIHIPRILCDALVEVFSHLHNMPDQVLYKDMHITQQCMYKCKLLIKYTVAYAAVS